MNPNTTIRPWLLSVGEPLGIRHAYLDRLNDPDTRPEMEYFVYKIMSTEPIDSGTRDLTTAVGNDADVRGIQAHETRVQVDLYRSQNGIDDLAACGVAANHNEPIRRIFDEHGVGFKRVVSIDNLTLTDTDETNRDWLYHHRMICIFEENAEYTIRETNAVVDTLVLTLDEDGPTYNIDRDGVTIP